MNFQKFISEQYSIREIHLNGVKNCENVDTFCNLVFKTQDDQLVNAEWIYNQNVQHGVYLLDDDHKIVITYTSYMTFHIFNWKQKKKVYLINYN